MRTRTSRRYRAERKQLEGGEIRDVVQDVLQTGRAQIIFEPLKEMIRALISSTDVRRGREDRQ